MGIPSYFSWLVRHFEKKIIKVESPFTASHHFYLDLNCAIHPVVKSHPEYSLDKMCDQVVIYLDYLINYVRPTELIYIAIDGVAPVAKMKQQRLRRYKSIKETEETNKLKRQYGQQLPSHEWDFNMISPATHFMATLTTKIDAYLKQLKEVRSTLSSPKIIFSDASVPAEGEHKILQHIKTQTPPDKNCVIYGLDSDLIMLALCTQRDNIVLIREDNFLKNNQVDLAIDKYPKLNYFLVNQLKQILFAVLISDKPISDFAYEKEATVDEKLCVATSQYEIERVIQDYILISFLLGNDFLPSCLCLSIRDGGIEKVVEAYRQVLKRIVPSQSGKHLYMCDSNLSINAEFFITFISLLATQEESYLKRQKISRDKRVTNYIDTSPVNYTTAVDHYQKIEHLYKDKINVFQSGWQQRYYQHFFHTRYNHSCSQQLAETKTQICAEYLLGIQWVKLYYFEQCPDWSWMYPYEATPLLEDFLPYLRTHLMDLSVSKPAQFTHDHPLKPLHQLMMILPPQSGHLLPKAYQSYMISDCSPLIGYYPIDFELDLYGKRFRWETHPQIPLIDPQILPYYLDGLETTLSEIEKQRNALGQSKEY